MNLQKVAPALAEHLAEFGTGQSEIESAKDLRHLAGRRVIWEIAVIFAGVALAMIGKKFIHNEEVGGAGALISIIGMFLTTYFLLSAEYKPASAERRLPPETNLSGAKTTAQLPPERLADATPSITERTTDLLESAAGQPIERKRSNEQWERPASAPIATADARLKEHAARNADELSDSWHRRAQNRR